MAQRTDKAQIIEAAKKLMAEKGYSQKKAAKELGVSQSALNAWLRNGKPEATRNINRDWNQPKVTGGSKNMKMVTLGECVNCGRPVVVAKWVAEYATWPIEHCSRECRLGRKSNDAEEEAI